MTPNMALVLCINVFQHFPDLIFHTIGKLRHATQYYFNNIFQWNSILLYLADKIQWAWQGGAVTQSLHLLI